MTNVRTLMLLLGTLAVLPMCACAPRCFRHTGCHVECKYCPAPPLPYLYYPQCVCHSCPASPYLTVAPDTASDADAHADGGPGETSGAAPPYSSGVSP
jgi:hypothetical protein